MSFKILLLALCVTSISYGQSWEKTFLSDTGLAKGFDVIQTSDNGYVMVGEVDLPTGAIRHYIWLIKTDNSGDQLWSKIYSGGGISNQTGRAITEASNGDLFIAGSNGSKASVLKTNVNGDSLWTKDFGGLGINSFQDIAQDTKGNLILVGQFEEEFNSGLHQAWVMSMNTQGDSLWSERYFEPSFNGSIATDISTLSSNNFLIIGNTGGQGFSMKIAGLDGSQEWFNLYQLSVGDNLYSGTTFNEEVSFLIGGNITGIAGFSPVLFEADTEGALTNFVNFSPTSFGTITSLASTADAGLVLTGSSFNFWDQAFSNMTGFVSKLDANLEVEWTLNYADSLDKQGAAIKQDLDGNFILAGSRKGGMWLKKIMGNANSSDNITAGYPDIQVYPNPAHSFINITVPKLIKTEGLYIAIYDALGRLVQNKKVQSHVELIDVGWLAKRCLLLFCSRHFSRSSPRKNHFTMMIGQKNWRCIKCKTVS